MEFTEITKETVEQYFKDPIFLDELNILVKKILIDNFKLSNVGKSVHYKILSFLITNYFEFDIEQIKISDLKRKLGNVSWKKLYAILYQLANKELVMLDTKTKTVALHSNLIGIIFSLTLAVQNFDYFIQTFFEKLDTKKLKLSEFKELARAFLKGKTYLSYFEKSILYGLFVRYLEETYETKIVLKKKDIEELTENDILILDYKTRFNSEGIIKKQIVKLKNIIAKATEQYQYALFITLTTDPSKQDILTALREISKAFKKFRDAVSRRLGEQIKYLKVLEFTKSGLPHLHILVFTNCIKDKKGNWVLKQDWISKLWDKYGFGKIARVYATKRQGKTYTWLNFKPANCKTNSLSNYLAKYLEKSFKNDLELMYYWVSNLRFYTYSYKLYKEDKPKKSKKTIWEFVGVCKEEDLKEFIEELKQKLEVKNINNINRYSYDYERWFSTLEGIYKLWVI